MDVPTVFTRSLDIKATEKHCNGYGWHCPYMQRNGPTFLWAVCLVLRVDLFADKADRSKICRTKSCMGS